MTYTFDLVSENLTFKGSELWNHGKHKWDIFNGNPALLMYTPIGGFRTFAIVACKYGFENDRTVNEQVLEYLFALGEQDNDDEFSFDFGDDESDPSEKLEPEVSDIG